MSTIYAVVMAGGRGERFWPLSTEAFAKPFIPLLGRQTLLQVTVERLVPLIPPGRILISIGESHREIACRQLPDIPEENFIVEPVGRDTSACLGFAALHLEQREPECIMLAVPSDHYIDNAEGYLRTLKKGIASLEGATAVLFGVRPARPETGYGYIQAEKPAAQVDAWPVIRFVEKPDATTAARYVQSGDFFWNSGMFLWKNSTLLGLFEEHMPEMYRGLCEIRSLIGRSDARVEMFRIFSAFQRLSVDFAIMEKTSRLRLVPVEFVWDDIGNWSALERALPGDALGNVARGPHVAIDSVSCITYSDAGVVATFGVSELVVVQANGRVLVCPKDKAGDLKRLVTALGQDHFGAAAKQK